MSAADTPAIERCHMCGNIAATLAYRMIGLTRIDPALAKAAVMAEPDMCNGCCIDLGRAYWKNLKRRLACPASAARYGLAQIERSQMVRP